MALVFNGSTNTISGLANGGLPDGCILDADINGMAASKLSGALPAISGASLTNLPAGGKIVAVKQAVKSDSFTTTGNGTLITGLQITMDTPASSSSKYLVMACVVCMANNYGVGIKLTGTTNGDILMPSNSDAGSRVKMSGSHAYENRNDQNYMQTVMKLDAPATTAQQTYSVRSISASGHTLKVNRMNVDTDNSSYVRGCSSLTVFEVAG